MNVCQRHGAYTGACNGCSREWRQSHPNTASAIMRFANGNCTLRDLERARREDRGEQ